MRLPSGLHRGDASVAFGAEVNCLGGPPARSTSHRCVVLLFFSMDHSVTVNTAILPSGDNAGLPSRFMAQRSCGVIRRLVSVLLAAVASHPPARSVSNARILFMTVQTKFLEQRCVARVFDQVTIQRIGFPPRSRIHVAALDPTLEPDESWIQFTQTQMEKRNWTESGTVVGPEAL